jgi:hypothetical protein
MCTQKPPNNWSEPLYNNYCEAVIDYLTARILPRIKEKHDESMLRVRMLRSEWPDTYCLRWRHVNADAFVVRSPAGACAALGEPQDHHQIFEPCVQVPGACLTPICKMLRCPCFTHDLRNSF